VRERPPLLLYLASSSDPSRTAVGPALAAAAERAGWRFECYYDALRRGRHFGGGDPAAARPGWPNGSLVAGGRHADQLLWLSTHFRIAALGDTASALWPVLDELEAESLARTAQPHELYAAAFPRLGEPFPRRVLVIDATPQGEHRICVAPYLYPAFLAGEPAVGLEARAASGARKGVEELGAKRFEGLYVESARARAFPGGFAAHEGQIADRDYAEVTAELAERHAGWARGVLIGDPDLVATQLGRGVSLRLAPLYGRPQTRAITRAEAAIRSAREPVYGRQYDDHDFFTLARLGRGLQVVDPGPPFEAARRLGPEPTPPKDFADDPDDDQLERWAREGRVLSTLLLWCGMVRELDCLPRLIDLVAETGLSAGLLTTAEALELAGGSALFLLRVPTERGGVLGRLEPLLASTGRGVAAEVLLPESVLSNALAEARGAAAARLPPGPEGWWPLLDAPLEAVRPSRLAWRSGQPALLFEPRGDRIGEEPRSFPATARRPDLRAAVGTLVRRSALQRLFEPRREFDHARPGEIEPRIAEAVRGAGFSYMWTKARFGSPALALRSNGFVALTLTAGNWDGWSPFYTVGSARDLKRAERRLIRAARPGWLVGTIDSPLWALSGELLEHGSGLYRMATLTARGGASGLLVNTTPRVIARYARLLDDLGLLNA
jgi:hypothetical protein